MKKKYNVYDKEGNLEYILKVKEKEDGSMVYKLKTSKAEHWADHFRDTKLIKVTDTGNGVKIKTYEFDLEEGVELGYDSIEYLRIVLEAKNQLEGMNGDIVSEYTMIDAEVFDSKEEEEIELDFNPDDLMMSVITDLIKAGFLCR